MTRAAAFASNISKTHLFSSLKEDIDMKYYSTRDKNVSLSAAEAVKMGLSRDGGLLTPTRIPQIDRAFLERLTPLEYARRAAAVMALYIASAFCDSMRFWA